jgi:ammonium transporter, Amt family
MLGVFTVRFSSLILGVGGFIGNILTGFFANSAIIALDGVKNPGGVISGDWNLLAYNLMGSFAILGYSLVGTFLILLAINYIPGLHFRQSEHEETHGDIVEMGEVAYEFVDGHFPSFGEMKGKESPERTIV